MWKGRKEFLFAQAQVAVILALAHVGNTWPNSYPRNENHNPTMFWVMNACLGVAALMSLKHEPSTRGVQLLSRSQTEEWKGWMQFAFIMYHYYRAYFVYNEIRVFVSAVSKRSLYGVRCSSGSEKNKRWSMKLPLSCRSSNFSCRRSRVIHARRCSYEVPVKSLMYSHPHSTLYAYIVRLDDWLWKLSLL